MITKIIGENLKKNFKKYVLHKFRYLTVKNRMKSEFGHYNYYKKGNI